MKHGDEVYAVYTEMDPPVLLVGRYTQYAEHPEPVVLHVHYGRVIKSPVEGWYGNRQDAVRAKISELSVNYQQDLAKLQHLMGSTYASADLGGQSQRGADDSSRV